MHTEGWRGPTFPVLVLPCILCKERIITNSYDLSPSLALSLSLSLTHSLTHYYYYYYFLCHQPITTSTNKQVQGTESFLRSYSSTTTQEIARILRNPKHHHRIHKSPPLVPIPRQVNLVHGLPIDFCTIHSNIILLFTPTPYE